MLMPMLAVIGLAVVVWSAIVLANKAAERNAALFERYVQMRVEQTLERAYAHLDDDSEPHQCQNCHMWEAYGNAVLCDFCAVDAASSGEEA